MENQKPLTDIAKPQTYKVNVAQFYNEWGTGMTDDTQYIIPRAPNRWMSY